MARCIICGHPLRDHVASGCERHTFLRGRCACTFAQLAALPPDADAQAHRERSDWWDQQAMAAWRLASAARFDDAAEAALEASPS